MSAPSVAVTTDGVRIHVDVIGDGEPLLLLAGQANSRHWWDPVRPDLSARYRTIAVDARGTGGSDAPASGYSTRRLVGALAGPTAAARRVLAELMVTPDWLDRHPDGADAVLGDAGMNPAARRAHRRASADHDASADLGRIGAPTLVVHGTDDEFCPTANADLLVEGVPEAELVLFDGARHAYFLEHREKASRVVMEFLGRHPLHR